MAGSGPTGGGHSSHDGRYQKFGSPSGFMLAGMSTARTIVASMSTADASRRPSRRRGAQRRDDREPADHHRRRARHSRPIPGDTASSVQPALEALPHTASGVQFRAYLLGLEASDRTLVMAQAVRHDDRTLEAPSPSPRGPFGLALPLLIVVFSLVGYVVTSETIRRDRDSDAARRVEVDTVGAQDILGRARAYLVGLGNILAGDPVPGQQRFVQLAGGTAGGVGLLDAMWVERIPGFARSRYEARVGAPITRLTPAGTFEPAPPAASYLAATFTTNGSPELPPGVDVSRWPALATAIRDRSSASAVSASELGSLGGRPGFYLLDAGSFGHGPDSRGYLVVFVPQGWLTASTGGDPRRLAVSLDGRHLEGFDSSPARSASFGTLGRRWRIDVATAPLTGFQTLLPWLAIAWPIAAALIAVLVGRGIARRRRAEREVERIFDLSLDLLCIAGLDGHFKRVNPAFERTLGYTAQQLLSRPFLDFVHPDDRARTVEAMEVLERGEKLVQFENRYMCSDGSARWLQWSTRPMPDEGLMYAAARDVTDGRRAADELR